MAGKSYLAVVARVDALRPKRAMGHLTQGMPTVDEAREWAIKGFETLTGLRVWAVYEITPERWYVIESGSVKADEGWREQALAGLEDRARPLLEQLRLALIQAGPSAVYDDAGQEAEDAFQVKFAAAKKTTEELASMLIGDRLVAEFPDDPQPGEVVAWPCLVVKEPAGSDANVTVNADRDRHQMGFGGAEPLNQGQWVVIAVLATGCRRSHPYTEGNVTDVIDATGVGGGSVDPHGYGTALVSMLTSQHPAGGPLGSVRRAKVVPIQIAHAQQGYTTDQWAELGVDAAKMLGANIIVIPYASPEPMPRTQAAIATFVQTGGLVIAPSGDMREGYQGVYYPGADPNVTAVGAVDGVGHMPDWCAIGSHVDLLATGEQCPAAGSGESADLLTGTGPASVHVAAAAALLFTRWRELHGETPAAGNVRQLLECTRMGVGGDSEIPFSGPGIINVGAALHQIIPPEPQGTKLFNLALDRHDFLKGATIMRFDGSITSWRELCQQLEAWAKNDESDRLFITKTGSLPMDGGK